MTCIQPISFCYFGSRLFPSRENLLGKTCFRNDLIIIYHKYDYCRCSTRTHNVCYWKNHNVVTVYWFASLKRASLKIYSSAKKSLISVSWHIINFPSFSIRSVVLSLLHPYFWGSPAKVFFQLHWSIDEASGAFRQICRARNQWKWKFYNLFIDLLLVVCFARGKKVVAWWLLFRPIIALVGVINVLCNSHRNGFTPCNWVFKSSYVLNECKQWHKNTALNFNEWRSNWTFCLTNTFSSLSLFFTVCYQIGN